MTPGGKHVGLASSVVPAVVGLVASCVLLVDYVQPAPVFCGPGGGCDAVKHSAYAWIKGVPTPLFGVIGFALLGTLSLTAGRVARVAQLAAAVAGAAMALFFLNVQRQLGTYCTYCVIADSSMIVLALASAVRLRTGWDAAPGTPRFVSGGALAGAVVVPLIVANARSAPPPPDTALEEELPPVIAEELKKTPKGMATVIDFVDFECPFCRRTHGELTPVLSTKRDRVRVVRKHVPLTTLHPHAMDAARAACCGEELGRGDALAEELFTAPPEALTATGCERLAEKVGLSLDAYRSCVADPRTDARIEADRTMFKAAHGKGLPTLWVDQQRLDGAQPRERLEEVIGQAVTRAGS